MEFELIETERFRLRKVTDEQYEHILKNSPDETIMEFFGIGTVETLEKEKQKAVKGFATFNKSLLIFQILNKETNELIGGCGYHTWYIDHARAELGYGLVSDDHKRKGIMSEVLAAVLRYGFNVMKLQRVEALIGPDNDASLATVKKFGFVQEGRLRKHYFVNDRFEDSVLFSLLAEEFAG